MGNINNISGFLERFKKILSSEAFVREGVAEAVFEVTKIKVDPKKIKVKNYTAHIEVSPLVKGEIFIKKSEILKNITSTKKISQEVKDLR